ncbi:hypothetical protein MTO96_019311 [Rhipicephalus appendiculatus]
MSAAAAPPAAPAAAPAAAPPAASSAAPPSQHEEEGGEEPEDAGSKQQGEAGLPTGSRPSLTFLLGVAVAVITLVGVVAYFALQPAADHDATTPTTKVTPAAETVTNETSGAVTAGEGHNMTADFLVDYMATGDAEADKK